MTKVGSTGTQTGMTLRQKVGFLNVMGYFTKIDLFVHGDCKGSDEEAHNLIRQNFKDVRIRIRPPIKHEKRAFCVGDEMMPPEDYLPRDRKVVDDIDVLVGTPKEDKEVLRSGTWYTIRYAKKRKKKIYIIYPNGQIEYFWEKENGTQKIF